MPRIEKVTTAYAIVTELVEMRGIEPLSEKILPRVSECSPVHIYL